MKPFLLLLVLPAIASAQPLLLPSTDQPATVYDANGQRYDVPPSPFGSTIYGPNNERFDAVQNRDGSVVVYDQSGNRVSESYPSLIDSVPASRE